MSTGRRAGGDALVTPDLAWRARRELEDEEQRRKIAEDIGTFEPHLAAAGTAQLRESLGVAAQVQGQVSEEQHRLIGLAAQKAFYLGVHAMRLAVREFLSMGVQADCPCRGADQPSSGKAAPQTDDDARNGREHPSC
ncbi:MAG: hypothetical protein HY369_03695 [Candidatus Aenigmarchaeota archaeon]|nr:hypothetical protein [Candidatus Aenigmarchaeota archaeon]